MTQNKPLAEYIGITEVTTRSHDQMVVEAYTEEQQFDWWFAGFARAKQKPWSASATLFQTISQQQEELCSAALELRSRSVRQIYTR